MPAGDADSQRLDLWLWCARFLRQRADCARLAEEGGIRINRQPTSKAHARVRVGDVLTLPLPGRVLVVEVRALAERRGPPDTVRRLYAERDATPACASPACASPQSTAYRADQTSGSA